MSSTDTSSVSSTSTSTEESHTKATNDSSWDTNKPSQALFYLAIVVGVLIAALFILFTLRYFIRSHLGLLFSLSSSNDLRGISNGWFSHRYSHGSPFNFWDPHLLPDNLHVAHSSLNKFSKKFRLTAEELEYLFPRRTYSDWLNGGATKDAIQRDIHAKIKYSEGVDEPENKEVVDDAAIANEKQVSSQVELNTVQDIDLADLSHEVCIQKGSEFITGNDNDDLKSLNTLKSAVSIHQPPDGVEEPHFSSGSCAICIEEFEPTDIVRGLICGHVFHKDCVDTWLSNRKACCPLCKRDYYLRNRVLETPRNSANASRSTSANGENDPYELLSPEEIARLHDAEQNARERERLVFLNLGLWGRSAPLTTNIGAGTGVGTAPDVSTGAAVVGIGTQSIFVPDLRTYNQVLHTTVPLSHRAVEALEQHPELEAIATAKVESEYYSWKHRLLWRLMGVSKQDLIDSVVVARWEAIQAEESNSRDEHANSANENVAETIGSEENQTNTRVDSTPSETGVIQEPQAVSESQRVQRNVVERLA